MKEALDRIYNALKSGDSYGKPMRYRYTHGELGGTEYYAYVLYYNNRHFIWNYNGMSLHKPTKTELRWILKNIFKMTPVEFEQRFIKESAFYGE